MDVFMKSAAGVLIAVVMSLVLSRQGKDYAVLLVICVCCMVGAASIIYIEKIVDFMKSLESIGNLNHELLSVLFKCVGIGLLSEITTTICTDSGNTALGKMLQILSASVILWLCIPMFTKLLELVQQVLGGV